MTTLIYTLTSFARDSSDCADPTALHNLTTMLAQPGISELLTQPGLMQKLLALNATQSAAVVGNTTSSPSFSPSSTAPQINNQINNPSAAVSGSVASIPSFSPSSTAQQTNNQINNHNHYSGLNIHVATTKKRVHKIEAWSPPCTERIKQEFESRRAVNDKSVKAKYTGVVPPTASAAIQMNLQDRLFWCFDLGKGFTAEPNTVRRNSV